tara:strand:- start:310 stop:906 length:597 start_codon:yes stop_codon:yes gene_type:complete
MPSQIQVSSVKALDGTAGISIADSTGRVSFTETNPSLTLGTNTTFPSGHVLQTVFGAHNTTNPSATTSSSYVATALTVQITPIQANAKIFICTNIGSTHLDELGNHEGGYFMIYNTTGSATAVSGSAWRTYQLINGGSLTHSYSYESSGGWCVETLSGQQNTQQTYTLYVKSTVGSFYFFNGQDAENPAKMYAQELAV